ncbi:lysozyme family protein [Nitrincola alkalisediminis]|uniref:hypothetical protein n=1 Tax=Nitrincola alkalisediminis TaxID=1366656 RepID=UPI0018741514|nr:hypothetical protein [Nitrincola alkalisediminis]
MLSAQIQHVLKSKLESYEGRVPHMYKDTKGFVTIGIGHLITSAQAAERLPLRKLNGSVATATEKRSEYEAIKALPNGNNVASYFRQHATLVLSNAEIDRLIYLHIFNFHQELKRLFPEFDSFPEDAKLGLFDMIFNLGMTKLRSIFINFYTAVQDQDWEKAAAESYRRDVNQSRNNYVRELFLKAAEVEIES